MKKYFILLVLLSIVTTHNNINAQRRKKSSHKSSSQKIQLHSIEFNGGVGADMNMLELGANFTRASARKHPRTDGISVRLFQDYQIHSLQTGYKSSFRLSRPARRIIFSLTTQGLVGYNYYKKYNDLSDYNFDFTVGQLFMLNPNSPQLFHFKLGMQQNLYYLPGNHLYFNLNLVGGIVLNFN